MTPSFQIGVVALLLASLIWAATLVAAPYIVSRVSDDAPVLRAAAVVYALASFICHQRPERSFRLCWCAGPGLREVRRSLSGSAVRHCLAGRPPSSLSNGHRVTPHVAANHRRGLDPDPDDPGVGVDDRRDDFGCRARGCRRCARCGGCGSRDGRRCWRLAVSRAGCGRLSRWR